MEKTTYTNLDTGEGIAAYTQKAKQNITFFDTLFESDFRKIADLHLHKPEQENKQLIEKICRLTSLAQSVVEKINVGDELLNADGRLMDAFGCTAVAHGQQIGQTLDFFTLRKAERPYL